MTVTTHSTLSTAVAEDYSTGSGGYELEQAIPEVTRRAFDMYTRYPYDAPGSDVGQTPLGEQTAATKGTIDLPAPIILNSVGRGVTTLLALQEWEGYVTAISDEHFSATLVDLTAGQVTAEQQAEIPLEELSQIDSSKLAPGRIFRWVIGYQTEPTGTRKRVSQIVFRDLPRWSTREREAAAKQAKDMVDFLNSKKVGEPDPDSPGSG